MSDASLDSDDHRQLGQRLDLFHFQDEAPGMVFWHPRGLVLYRLLEEVIRRHLRADEYREVRTPQLLRQPIWEASGHWQNFAEDMFLVDADGRRAALKPVSCPGHLQLLRHANASYRDLPMRIAEFGLVHRNEPSGSLLGLFRLRQFTQDDGHIFCAAVEVEAEVARFAAGLRSFYSAFGFADVSVALSTRPEKRAGDDALWERAESMLAEAARGAGLAFAMQVGQGAFYGPKLEFALRDRLGRAWQCGTIQLDFVLPERFDVHYVDGDGARRRPVMLHRALLGSLERFLGILLEQSGGVLPAWLAPVQLQVVTVAAEHADYAREVARAARLAGLRVEIDARPETLSRKVLAAHADGIPYLAVIGQREAASGSVTIRQRGGSQEVLPLARACAQLGAASSIPKEMGEPDNAMR
jgi:threonyl-tRNA synthetase